MSRVVVAVTGGIAAFKAVLVVRELTRRGHAVRVVMSEAATRFVGPVTFTGLTGQPPVVDLWDPSYAGEVHVELAAWADAMLVVPATANVMARAAVGQADDAVTTTLLCFAGPVLFAPAMHHRMWNHAATQRNVAQLVTDGAHMVGPVEGPLASGEQGMGRLAEPLDIVDALEGTLRRDLAGRRLLVTAGGTREDLDPVRFLGNRSTGKMGYAIARRAAARGAEVTLVSAPTALAVPVGVERVSVRSAEQMHAAVHARRAEVDVIVMAAAVADYRPAARADHKLKKQDGELAITLTRNPDILRGLGAWRREAGLSNPMLVGFAVETQDLVAAARSKLEKKAVDLIVANAAADSFGRDDNRAVLVSADEEQPLGVLGKDALADRILDRVAAQLTAD